MNKELKLLIDSGIKKEDAIKILRTFYMEGASSGITIIKLMPNIKSKEINETLEKSFNNMLCLE